LALCLLECATHVVFEAGFWPATTSEHRVAPRLRRAVTADMPLLWDCGFPSVSLPRANASAWGACAGSPARPCTAPADCAPAGRIGPGRPATQLAALSARRWAIEETFDELDTHQRLATRTLRRHTPVGVLQELSGLLLLLPAG
jgi:transposase